MLNYKYLHIISLYCFFTAGLFISGTQSSLRADSLTLNNGVTYKNVKTRPGKGFHYVAFKNGTVLKIKNSRLKVLTINKVRWWRLWWWRLGERKRTIPAPAAPPSTGADYRTFNPPPLQKRFFVYASGGVGKASSRFSRTLAAQYQYNVDTFTSLGSSNANYQFLGQVQFLSRDNIRHTSKSGRLGMEYGIKSWLSFGLSLNYESEKIEDARISNYGWRKLLLDPALSYIYLFYDSSTAYSNFDPSLDQYYWSLQEHNLNVSVTRILDVELGFHFLRNRFASPSFKIVIGSGKTNRKAVNKLGAIFMLKSWFTDRLFLSTEIHLDYFQMYDGQVRIGKNQRGFNSNSNQGLRLGLGWAL